MSEIESLPSSFTQAVSAEGGWLPYVARCLASLSIFFMLILLALEVVGRNVFHMSFDFVLEISGYLLVSSFFFSLGACYSVGAFHRIEMFRGRLSRTSRDKLDLIWDILTLIVCLIVLWFLMRYEWLSFQRGETANSELRTALWIPRLPMVLGMIVFCLTIVQSIIKGCRLVWRQGQSAEQNIRPASTENRA